MFAPADPPLPSASGRRSGAVRWRGAPALSCACRLGVCACVAPSWTEAMVSALWAWCFPSLFRSGFAGEAVKLLWVLVFFLVPLAGRGGEERVWRWSVSHFCCRWCCLVLSGGPAPAGRGGEGSRLWRWWSAGGGGPARRGGGWKIGGRVRMVLWPWSFNDSRFRRCAADGSCGCLLHVVALPLDGGRYGAAGGA